VASALSDLVDVIDLISGWLIKKAPVPFGEPPSNETRILREVCFPILSLWGNVECAEGEVGRFISLSGSVREKERRFQEQRGLQDELSKEKWEYLFVSRNGSD
jgi:hypothetical protein